MGGGEWQRCKHFYPRSPRGERPPVRRPKQEMPNFYPRSPRGERPEYRRCFWPSWKISIHAPREGSDACRIWDWFGASSFLSTLPARGATDFLLFGLCQGKISIHAPREGSDLYLFHRFPGHQLISIHAPREGSDVPQHGCQPVFGISIHAPREGSDSKCAEK